MIVICKANKKCVYKKECQHSKPHEKIEGYKFGENCYGYVGDDCECSDKYLNIYYRKEKLKKINESKV